jgi:hypothetical protein
VFIRVQAANDFASWPQPWSMTSNGNRSPNATPAGRYKRKRRAPATPTVSPAIQSPRPDDGRCRPIAASVAWRATAAPASSVRRVSKEAPRVKDLAQAEERERRAKSLVR